MPFITDSLQYGLFYKHYMDNKQERQKRIKKFLFGYTTSQLERPSVVKEAFYSKL